MSERDIRATWVCNAEFTGRRVAVALSPAWEAIYLLDFNTETARFAGNLIPEVASVPPCYDREVGHLIEADGAEAVLVLSGRNRDHYFLVDNRGIRR